MKKIIFIDRDGCLIEEPPAKPENPDWVDYQVDSLKKLKFLPAAIDSLQQLINSGFTLILVSNQDGRGTETFPEESFQKPHKEMLKVLKESKVEFEREFICPHFPEDNCECRKPKVSSGLRDYLDKTIIDLTQTFMIGDRDSDMEFARNIGCKGLKISSENGWEKILSLINESEDYNPRLQ